MEEFETLNAEYADGAAVCHWETLKFTHLIYHDTLANEDNSFWNYIR